MQAIEEASVEQAAEVHKRYSDERQELITQEVELKAKVTEKSIQDSQKEADEKKRLAQDAHDKLIQLDAERLESEGQNLESRLMLIEQEKTQRLQQFEELRTKEKEVQETLFNLRFQHATGLLENTMRIPVTKKDLARIKTVIRSKQTT